MFSFFWFSTVGQNLYNDPNTYSGVIILKDGTIYRGNLTYNQGKEKLLCHSKDGFTEHQASSVAFFQFYDPEEGLNRYFYSLLTDARDSKFFELLLLGEISLYRKSYLIDESIEHKQNLIIFNLEGQIDYHLYFKTDGFITKLVKFENDVLPLMKGKIAEISSFITEKKLNLNSYKDQLALIDHYNTVTLKQKKTLN